MTFDERARGVADYGFTPRQAAFLTTVMLHAGVCLPRQYTKFCGIVFGHTTRDFFARLTAQRFATGHACWRRGGTFYHIHHKGLYRAIGEPDHRHRRRVTIPRAVERLMLLDVVLDQAEVTWLATTREKLQYFVMEHQCGLIDLPSVMCGEGSRQTARYFIEKLPIGRGTRDQEVVFVYLVTDPRIESFRRFLASHRRLFQRLQCWTLQLVFPWFLASNQARFERAATVLFALPLRPVVVDEFRWFCEQRRVLEQTRTALPAALQGRYARARRAFGEPRFSDAYHQWLEHGDASLQALLASVLWEAWQRGDVRVMTRVQPHRYLHLARSAMTA
jgi:hypothetical protein